MIQRYFLKDIFLKIFFQRYLSYPEKFFVQRCYLIQRNTENNGSYYFVFSIGTPCIVQLFFVLNAKGLSMIICQSPWDLE